MKHQLPFFEMMATNVCNLSCQGCTTFSDLQHSGYMTWAEAREEIIPWMERVEFQAFGFMGGEPLINPYINDWIVGVRELLPNTQIRFITNGILLEKNWWVVDLLDQVGNSTLKISQHITDQRITDAVSRMFREYELEPVHEHGIKNRYRTPSGLRFQVKVPDTFIQTFQGTYETMSPHDNTPKDAFDICVQKHCPMLYQGRLWKCGTAALTQEVVERHGRPNWNEWQPYFDTGISPNCEDSVLEAFIRNFGQPHTMCRQCPSKDNIESRFDHSKTVKFK